MTHGPWRSVLVATATGVILVLGAGCSAAPDEDAGPTPAQVMAAAKQTLDDTTGVRIDLSTENLPEGIDGVVGASGVGTHAPAFDGTITVALGGATFDVPVISVDDIVYAKIPLTIGWSEDIDPAEYGAPDPARLMDTEAGFSSLLTAAEGLQAGESVRGGEDNDEVLTEYSGTVAGDVMTNVIPSASGSFDVTYTVSAGDELRTMTMTGVFYPDSSPMTYLVAFNDYGTQRDIVAP